MPSAGRTEEVVEQALDHLASMPSTLVVVWTATPERAKVMYEVLATRAAYRRMNLERRDAARELASLGDDRAIKVLARSTDTYAGRRPTLTLEPEPAVVRPVAPTWVFDAFTADGVHVRVEQEPLRVVIDDAEQDVLDTGVLRDGGTRTFRCAGGTLTLPHRLGDSDRTPIWSAS